MAYQPLEKLLPRASGSIYKLVIMAAKRATELADGMPKLVEFPSSQKTTTIALDEVVEGKVMLKEVAEVEGGKKKDKVKEEKPAEAEKKE